MFLLIEESEKYYKPVSQDGQLLINTEVFHEYFWREKN